MHHIGKFIEFAYPNYVEKYSDVQLDMLYFVMDTVDIQRFTSSESFREFLIRYFLVRDKEFDENAMDIINEELLFDGFIGDEYFSITIGDLVHLIGFSISTLKFNIYGSMEDFIEDYSFKVPHIKFMQKEGEENTYHINSDGLAYVMAGLNNLLNIENCSLTFKTSLKNTTPQEVESAEKLADYVMNHLPANLFEQYDLDFPNVKINVEEWYLKAKEVTFDVYKDMDQENLAKIYEIIADKSLADEFRQNGPNEDMRDMFKFENEHIVFAYGVKHGYIELSEDMYSGMTHISPLLNIDFELLQGIEGEVYRTQTVYDSYKMGEWLHLLP
jgi:hypothetical protein